MNYMYIHTYIHLNIYNNILQLIIESNPMLSGSCDLKIFSINADLLVKIDMSSELSTLTIVHTYNFYSIWVYQSNKLMVSVL